MRCRQPSTIMSDTEEGEVRNDDRSNNSDAPPALAIDIKDVTSAANQQLFKVAKYSFLWKHLDAGASHSKASAHVLGAWNKLKASKQSKPFEGDYGLILATLSGAPKKLFVEAREEAGGTMEGVVRAFLAKLFEAQDRASHYRAMMQPAKRASGLWVADLWCRLTLLNEYASFLPGDSKKLTDDKLKVALHMWQPPAWRSRVEGVESMSLFDVFYFYTLQESAAQELMKKNSIEQKALSRAKGWAGDGRAAAAATQYHNKHKEPGDWYLRINNVADFSAMSGFNFALRFGANCSEYAELFREWKQNKAATESDKILFVAFERMFEAQARRCVSKAFDLTGSNAEDAITAAMLEPGSKKCKLSDGVDNDAEDYDELFDNDKATYETNSSIFIKQLQGKNRCAECHESERKEFRFSAASMQATKRFFAFYIQGMCTCGVVKECLTFDTPNNVDRFYPDPIAIKVDAQIAKDNGDSYSYKHLVVVSERIQNYVMGNHGARAGYNRFPLA